MKLVNLIISFGIVVSITGCNDASSSKVVQNLDGKTLLKQKCSHCHNINFPPKEFDNEIAPPMLTISFHFQDWFKAATDAEKLHNQIAFVKDYVLNPSVDKAYCTKDMLKKFGLMPSQKGKVTKDEIEAIARYVFTTYTPQNLSKKQKALRKLHSLPQGEQLAIKYKCFSCHRKDKNLVGPSFKDIGLKYKNNIDQIKTSILNGSKNRWKNTHGASMPSFNNIPNNEINTISNWITSK